MEFLKFCFNSTMIFGTLAWTIELNMTKYIIGEIFSSGEATLYKNPSDQTVHQGKWRPENGDNLFNFGRSKLSKIKTWL